MQKALWCCFLGLVQKAKKAKDKLLKRDGDERTESSYESFYYGGVDPYMWEPQELGESSSHHHIQTLRCPCTHFYRRFIIRVGPNIGLITVF